MPIQWLSYNDKTIVKHLLYLGGLALVLRLVYLYLAVDHLGMDRFWHYANDTNFYWGIADHILVKRSFIGSYSLFLVGPGYGLIITAIRVLFGSDPLYTILFSVLMGTLAPMVIYLLAYHLLNNKTVAFIAGCISAISWTSISMSCHIMTDQPYFTIQATALLFYVLGFKFGRIKWFLFAGLLTGIAAYLRSMGMFWPVILLCVVLVMPVPRVFASRLAMIKRAAIPALIVLVMTVPWMVRNYVVHDVFTFGSNGGMALCTRLVAQMYAINEGKHSILEYGDIWNQEEGYLTENMGPGYKKAMERVIRAAVEHPDWMISAIWKNIDENIRTYNYFVLRQMPYGVDVIETINRRFCHWGGYVLLFLTIAGLIIMIIKGKHPAWLILGSAYFFYTIIVGVSFWQGSRLHYPAEMAWSIIVAYCVYVVATKIKMAILRTSSTRS
ncbi:MAG: glycosyltransferase family 39 protein [candidate division Zixibacteria bacterium]|nr:glycosyltransferase family 39 protein [candidate division Zixibacteria bacterium]